MSNKHASHKTPEISPEAFPALSEFVRGYFHEDLVDDYGSPQGAARQFWLDADPDQRQAVANEWSRFLRQTKGQPVTEINQFLTAKLGSACLLTDADLKKVTTVLNSVEDF